MLASTKHPQATLSSDEEDIVKTSPPKVSNPLSELKTLDSLLKCPSCFDYIRTAMILPNCHHNFCSLCIRKYFCYKTQCPACSAPASGPELRNNRLLDNVIEQYRKLRKPLKQMIRSQSENKIAETELSTEETCTRSSVVAAVNIKSTEQEVKHKELVTADLDSDIEIWEEGTKKSSIKFTDYESDSDFFEKDKKLKTKPLLTATDYSFEEIFPNINGLMKTETIADSNDSFTCLKPSSLSEDTDKPSCSTPISSQNSDKVDCPVCGVAVRSHLINQHLDTCIHKTEKIESLRSSTKKKPLTKLVYHLLSDKDLKARLKDLGLSTEGSRKVLIKRHKDFSLLHNSDCDSLNPRSTPDLVRYFEKEERLKKKLSESSNVKGLDINKNSDEVKIRQAQISYAKEHKKQFQDLIKQARNKSRFIVKGTLKTKVDEVKDGNGVDSNISSDISQQSEKLAHVIRQTLDDIGKIVSESSQESFELLPKSEFEIPEKITNDVQNSSKSITRNDLIDEANDSEKSITKTPCRKSLFGSKIINGLASPVLPSPMPPSPKIGSKVMNMSPRKTKLSHIGGDLFVGDSDSEFGDSTPTKDLSRIDNSVNTTDGNEISSELWPALSTKASEQQNNIGDIVAAVDNDVDDIDEDDDDASDIVPIGDTQPPSIDSIRFPTRLSMQLKETTSVRTSERQKRKAEQANDTRPAKKLRY